MSLALILKSTLRGEKARMIRDLLSAKLRRKRIFLALAILFLFALLLDTLGFPVMVLLFLACLFRFIDPQPWKTVIRWALAGTVGFYLVFEYWLSLRLPDRAVGILTMDVFAQIYLGFSVALQPANLMFAMVGAILGTMVGVLPGLGPTAAMSLLLPATFGLSPVGSMIMLAGIYYGAQYGGSTTSILVNIPGEAASVVTCLGGYQMARQGRTGAALGISAFGSFIAGTLALLGLTFMAPMLVEAALTFGPAE